MGNKEGIWKDRRRERRIVIKMGEEEEGKIGYTRGRQEEGESRKRGEEEKRKKR